MGVNRVSFCFEIFDPEIFRRVCPGKNRQYGLERYLGAVEYCAGIARRGSLGFQPWVSNGEIIAGLEPPESTMAAIDWITSVGAIPNVCVFRPLVGTDMEDEPPPRTEDLVPVFRRLYQSCMERNLPVGVAPNISLVLLPEECRWLSDKRRKNCWKELRLKAMARAFRFSFDRGVRRAMASAGRLS